MKLAFIISILIILNSTVSCNSLKQKNNGLEIIEIGDAKNCGNKGGSFSYFKITKDSTIKIYGSKRLPHLGDTLRSKTNPKDWNKLLKIVFIKDFLSLKSVLLGNPQADGCVQYAYIKTKDSTYQKGGLRIRGDINKVNTIQELIR